MNKTIECRRNQKKILQVPSTLRCKVRFSLRLEAILHSELNAPSGSYGISRLTKSRSFKKPHRNAEVSAIDKVENIGPKLQSFSFSDFENLDERQI